MKINNSLDVALWEKITCKCDHSSIETEYPIANCEHCRCQEGWDSVPKEDFTVKEFDTNEDGEIIGSHDKVINEITLVRGHKLQDVIGWKF